MKHLVPVNKAVEKRSMATVALQRRSVIVRTARKTPSTGNHVVVLQNLPITCFQTLKTHLVMSKKTLTTSKIQNLVTVIKRVVICPVKSRSITTSLTWKIWTEQVRVMRSTLPRHNPTRKTLHGNASRKHGPSLTAYKTKQQLEVSLNFPISTTPWSIQTTRVCLTWWNFSFDPRWMSFGGCSLLRRNLLTWKKPRRMQPPDLVYRSSNRKSS
mmetsp:Transcript_1857/g.5906  ORF Transcript_1857/g.5906 Transcript_1857/m.5906 type:complete len:213 (+) Transcript_1857:1003-1641(+)